MIKDIFKIAGAIFLIVILTYTIKFLCKPAAVIDKVTDPDHIISSYEDFQDMYNTCKQICIQIQMLGVAY